MSQEGIIIDGEDERPSNPVDVAACNLWAAMQKFRQVSQQPAGFVANEASTTVVYYGSAMSVMQLIAEQHNLTAYFDASAMHVAQADEVVEQKQGARFREETFTVRTAWSHTDQITQTVAGPSGEVMKRSLDTMEKQVRESLVAMGWTPPGGKT